MIRNKDYIVSLNINYITIVQLRNVHNEKVKIKVKLLTVIMFLFLTILFNMALYGIETVLK